VRRAVADVRGTERTFEPAGALAVRAWGATGHAGGAVRGALGVDGGGDPGDPEGRRGVCATGSGLSSGAPAVPGVGCAVEDCRHAGERAGEVAGDRGRGDCAGPGLGSDWRLRADGSGCEADGAEARASCVRDLYVGIHRPSQGSDGGAPTGAAPVGLDAGALWI